MTKDSLLGETWAMMDWLVDTRRSLHRIPEGGDEEYETQRELCRILDGLGLPYEKRKTSVVALVEGGKPGPVVGMRADMDALPVVEPENRPNRSRHEGYMHACGHDAHMTVALGAARYFAARKQGLKGSVKLLFQPAEETTGGAADMIAAGCLENPHVDYIIGCHVQPSVPVGMVELKHGAFNGASDVLRLVVKGKGGHAAYPDLGIDAIMIAAKVVDALHAVVSRYVSPLSEAVITLGTINGGTRNNIIADRVEMTGTIRTTDPAVRAVVGARVRSIVSGIPEALGGTGEAEIIPGYTALINHDWVVDLMAEKAREILGSDSIHWKEKPSLGVEDFSFFLQERPGAFYHLGCGNPGRGITAALHSRDFDIDEACLPVGVAMHVATTLALLGKKP
ncbi:MAG: M20 family metallopeptidase [Spirochaetes bacterium]|nr:M20 family metallopeptidase [Spirochaetota bacterium]